MKLRHTLYPSPLVYTAHDGEAHFSGYHFETSDRKLGEALRKSRDIVEVRPPKKPATAPAKKSEA